MISGLSIAAVSVVLFLGWNLYRRLGADRIGALCETRRSASRIVSRGEFVDGNRHLEVALALTGTTFFYETADMQASLELQWVKEIEYDTHLATGNIATAGRVLRLRCYSQVFEFVLPNDVVPRWYMLLPPRRASSLVVPDVAPELASA
jgi:hypothetical protein